MSFFDDVVYAIERPLDFGHCTMFADATVSVTSRVDGGPDMHRITNAEYRAWLTEQFAAWYATPDGQSWLRDHPKCPDAALHLRSV